MGQTRIGSGWEGLPGEGELRHGRARGEAEGVQSRDGEQVEDQEFKLLSEITDLTAGKGTLEGTFSFDTVFVVRHREKAVPVPRTYEAPFSFNLYKDRLFLTVYDKKNRANNIANEMSKAVFLSLGQIVEARIDPETLRKFHEKNFEDTKIIFFDDMDLPSINKLSLYGASLGNTSTLFGLSHSWEAVVHRAEELEDRLRDGGDQELRRHRLQQDGHVRIQLVHQGRDTPADRIAC